jgi:putative toxin-antitoxin system antitoxin component (TIGR02293 family)
MPAGLNPTLFKMLGGRATLGARPSLKVVASQLEKGLPPRVFEALAESFGLTTPESLRILGVSPRTRSRWLATRRKALLPPPVSDRVYRMARVFAEAVEVLGDEQKAGRWLRAPIYSLNDARPLDLLGTDAGVQAVEAVLGRMRAGVYS